MIVKFALYFFSPSDSHEHLDHPGKFLERDLPDFSGRDWRERAFTVGIGGSVNVDNIRSFDINDFYWKLLRYDRALTKGHVVSISNCLAQ